MAAPTIGIVAAGAMGSAVARKLHAAGCIVLTNLDGRSEATRRRAREAGMEDTSLEQIALRAGLVLSILPPRDARSFAEKFLAAYTNALKDGSTNDHTKQLIFADCNAISPESVKGIASLFSKTNIFFIDAGIIGGPPLDGYDPTFYASSAPQDEAILQKFVSLSQYGLKISLLKGDNVGIGDASALKMSYAGITKGTTGLFTTMILAAYASSPATAEALMHELHSSQPAFLRRITTAIPPMLPKAYRWVGEMEEIAAFVGDGEEDIYHGLARLYQRVEGSMESGTGDVDTLKSFVEKAKRIIDESTR